MRVLVACEFSGRVRDAFIERGHDAWSCDIVPTDAPGPHYQCDVLDILNDEWDLIIAFPPCTYLTNASAVRMFPKKVLCQDRYEKMLEARGLFLAILNAPCPRIAIENPMPLSIAKLPPKTQEIQPFHFGEPVRKKTYLWLKNLPPLVPSDIVEPEINWINAGSKGRPKHAVAAKHRSPKMRSLTFQCVADAMADQWGKLEFSNKKPKPNLMIAYADFLKRKVISDSPCGFEPTLPISDVLFSFQKDIVRWSLKRGNAAIFAGCGLGKTAMQLEWAKHVAAHTGKPILIVAPLAVSMQTKREGLKFGIETNVIRSPQEIQDGINIINYEILDRFDDISVFSGVVLDESSILKPYMGKTKRTLVDEFRYIPYKLACTATPAPNDHMELLNHAAFLGVMESNEALSVWFANETNDSGKYRLKKHAVRSFWEWVSSWGVCIERPSDLGYEDDNFALPELKINQNVIEIDDLDFQDGTFFRTVETNATSFHKEKRKTVDHRAAEAARIASADAEQYLIWCYTDYEADALKKAIPEAVEVRGSDKYERKEQVGVDFIDGKIRVLISKPSIFGFGLNFQNCHNAIFCGLDYSYEAYYQAIRRVWRFGQKHPVNIHVVLGSTETHILDTIRRKELQHQEMLDQIAGELQEIRCRSIRGQGYTLNLNVPHIQIPNWLSTELTCK